jgi:hypothetical protein
MQASLAKTGLRQEVHSPRSHEEMLYQSELAALEENVQST